MTKPAVLIVPGAWSTPYHYQSLTSRLRDAGYKAACLHLPSTSPNPTTENHDSDVALTRSAVLEHLDAGEEVVLVLHSAGGIIGSEASAGLFKADREQQGKTGGIVRLVYIAAMAMLEGGSVWTLDGEGLAEWVVTEGPVCRPSRIEEVFYNDVPSSALKEVIAQHQLHSVACFKSTLSYAAWKWIPSTYLICEKDNAISLVGQEAMVSLPGANFTVERCAAGHFPMISMPEYTAEVVRRAAGEQI